MKKYLFTILFVLMVSAIQAQHANYLIDLSDTGIKFYNYSGYYSERVSLSGGSAVSGTYNQYPSMTEEQIKSLIQSRINSKGISGVTVTDAYYSLMLTISSTYTSRRITFLGAANTRFEVIQANTGDAVPDVMYLFNFAFNSNNSLIEVSPAGESVILSYTYNGKAIAEIAAQELSAYGTSWITVDKSHSNSNALYLVVSPNNSTNARRFCVYGAQGSIEIYQHAPLKFGLLESGTKKIVPGEYVPIQLSGSAQGITYLLKRRNPNNITETVETRQGYGSSISFNSVDKIGTYYVETGSGQRMDGELVVAYADIFTQKHIVYNASQQLDLPADGILTVIYCTKLKACDPFVLTKALTNFNKGIARSFWNPQIEISLLSEDASSIQFQLKCPPNISAGEIMNNAGFIFGSTSQQLKIRQPGNGGIVNQTVSGEYVDQSRVNYVIKLNNSQPYVNYTLYRNGYNMEKSAIGTGLPITFENLAGTATYTIKAEYTGLSSAFMSGSVTMSQLNPAPSFGNWVASTSYTSEKGINSIKDVTYYDGFGNPIQMINIQGGATESGTALNAKSIVTPVYYDAIKRETRSYLPYASTTSGAYESDAFDKQSTYYNSIYPGEGQYACSEKTLESSPLNRILKTTRPGSIYRNFFRSATYGYDSNGNDIKRFQYNHSTGTITLKGNYPANALLMNTVVNEDQTKTVTYSETSGKTIMERTVDDTEANNVRYHDTYYVYDDYDRLVWIVSPEGMSKISGQYGTVLGYTHDIARQYCYIYKYDHRDRVIEKRIPGADWIYMVYDRADRLVMSQDGNMRSDSKNQWMHNIYDTYNRPVKTELVSFSDANTTRTSLQNQYGKASGVLGFAADKLLLTERGYDEYPDTIGNELSFYIPQTISGTGNSNPLFTEFDFRTKGLLTYEKMAVIDGGEVTGGFVERAFYYDYKGRVIQTVEKNHLGGISRYSTKYDFVGNVLTSLEQHGYYGESPEADLVVTTRTVATEVLVIPDEGEPLVQGEYFLIGEWGYLQYRKINDPHSRYFISTSKIHDKYFICRDEDNNDYYYIPEDCLEMVYSVLNLSGSRAGYGSIPDFPGEEEPLTEIVDPPYYETVYQTVADSTYVYSRIFVESDRKQAEFTYDHRGRLLSEKTTLNDGEPAIVQYGYDELGKLASKSYGTGANTVTETYDYNIQGWLTSKTSDVFDMELRYYDPLKGTTPSYTGNITEWEWRHNDAGAGNAPNTYAFTYDKLSRLTDSELYEGAALVNTFAERGIAYDMNGNILSMKRYQGNASVPDEDMEFTAYDGNRLTTMENNGVPYGYDYDANGNMTSDGYNALKLKYNYLNLTAVASDMSDNVQATYSWLADGTKLGVIDADARAIISSDGTVVDRNDYYPYGLEWEYPGSQVSDNRYLYNGKEKQTVGIPSGVNYMDYVARILDLRLGGRWLSLDPMEQYHSGYVYCGNNPVNLVDPTGMFSVTLTGGVANLGRTKS